MQAGIQQQLRSQDRFYACLLTLKCSSSWDASVSDLSFASALQASCEVMQTCLKVQCDITREVQGIPPLSAVVLLAQTLKSTQAMADAMRGATKAMGAMNKQMNLPALTKIMREFERQNEKMEMTSEMMGDAVDDAFEVKPHQ